jgi:hypothetical protein
MSLGKYGLAMQALNPILSPYAGNRYADYANFYYALAAHSDGQLSLAVEKCGSCGAIHPNGTSGTK